MGRGQIDGLAGVEHLFGRGAHGTVHAECDRDKMKAAMPQTSTYVLWNGFVDFEHRNDTVLDLGQTGFEPVSGNSVGGENQL